MNEALLHTIWKYKLLAQDQFIGTKNERIQIVSVGEHNQDSGPDFFNSKVNINTILLAGNVEIHVRTSDWLKHHHQSNRAYDNLVLHVVYEHDVEIPQNERFNVSVLELKNYIKPSLLEEYQQIELSKQVIPCGKSILTVSHIVWRSWLDRLAITRLEGKTQSIERIFNQTQQHYEETLFVLLCRNFGFKINSDAFEWLGKMLPYAILKKYADNSVQVEALLFGVAGFLEELYDDDYPKLLQNEFEFLKQKHQLTTLKKENWKFSKTRPVNFPTIRLSQLGHLICQQKSLYHLLEHQPPMKELKDFFNGEATPYWQTHFKFDRLADFSPKPIGDAAFQSIVINTVVPFLIFMSKYQAKDSLVDYALDLLTQIPAEENTKTKEFTKLGVTTENALESQAQIHLYDALCSQKACLHCRVGEFLLKNSG